MYQFEFVPIRPSSCLTSLPLVDDKTQNFCICRVDSCWYSPLTLPVVLSRVELLLFSARQSSGTSNSAASAWFIPCDSTHKYKPHLPHTVSDAYSHMCDLILVRHVIQPVPAALTVIPAVNLGLELFKRDTWCMTAVSSREQHGGLISVGQSNMNSNMNSVLVHADTVDEDISAVFPADQTCEMEQHDWWTASVYHPAEWTLTTSHTIIICFQGFYANMLCELL